MRNVRIAFTSRTMAVAATAVLAAVVVTFGAGLGAIPVARADEPAESPALRQRAVPTAWIGIVFASGSQPSMKNERDADAAPPPPGVTVEGVFEGGPAEKGGLRAGDRILSIDGTAVGAPGDLLGVMRSLDPGSCATFAVHRGSSDRDVRICVAERPQDTTQLRLVRGWLGVKAIELPASLRTFFGAPEDAGILISEVTAGSPAEAAGIRVGDTLFAVGETQVRSVGELARLIMAAGVDNTLELRIARGGGEIVVEATTARYREDETAAR